MTMTTSLPATRILRIVDPTAPAFVATGGRRSLHTVEGKVLGVTGNGWGSWAALREAYLKHLSTEREAHGLSWDVPLGSKADPATLEEISIKCDAVVVGVANCGSCAVSTAANCNDLAEAGVPVVAVVTQRFERLVASLAPSLPLVVLPANLEQLDDAGLCALQPDLYADIEAKLTASTS